MIKYVASLTSFSTPKLAQVTVTCSTKKMIVTRNPISLLGNYKPTSHLYLAQYHIFDTKKEATDWLLSEAQKKVERLKDDLANLGF